MKMLRFFWLFVLGALFTACGGTDEENDSFVDNGPNQSTDNGEDVVVKDDHFLSIVGADDQHVIVLSPYGETITMVVASNSNVWADQEMDIFNVDWIRTRFTVKDSVVEGFDYVYNLIIEVDPNETYEEREAFVHRIVLQANLFLQHAILEVNESFESVDIASQGGTLESGVVETTFWENGSMSEFYEEVYYSDVEDAIESFPVRNKDYGFYTPLIIAPNPTTEGRIITVHYGIRNVETGKITDVHSYQVVQGGEPYANVQGTVSYSEDGQTFTITPMSNVNLQVSENLDWLEFTGVENGVYSFKLSANNSGEVRDGDIVFINSKQGVQTSVGVVQYSSDVVRVHLNEGETLESKLTKEQMVNTESLIITGDMSDEDYYTLSTYFTTLKFIDLSGLETNTISDTYGEFISIPSQAFINMALLKRVILPENIIDIPGSAFEGCKSLVSVNIPEKVVQIGSYAFQNCESLKSVNIPAGVTSIGHSAFWGCESLERVEIPYGVTELETGIFFECTSLKEVVLPNSITRFSTYGGGRGGSQFALCSSLEKINIPTEVKSLPEYCFLYCTSLESIDVSGITSFDDYVFSGATAMKSIEFNEDLSSIGMGCFEGCTLLKEIELPLGITSLGSGAFDGCVALEKANIPATLTEVPSNVFRGCTALTAIELPKSIISIGDAAFENTGITAIEFPENLMDIGDSAFKGCSLTEVNFPNGLKSIGSSAFEDNDFTILRIPESVTEIGMLAFAECKKLKKAIIKASITTLEYRTFFNCIDMTHLQLPKTLTTADDGAFSACQQVRYVYSEATTPPTGEGMRPLVWAFITTYVPSNLLETYKTADSWFNDSQYLRDIALYSLDFKQLDFEPTYAD